MKCKKKVLQEVNRNTNTNTNADTSTPLILNATSVTAISVVSIFRQVGPDIVLTKNSELKYRNALRNCYFIKRNIIRDTIITQWYRHTEQCNPLHVNPTAADYPQRYSDARIACRTISKGLTGRHTGLSAKC
jgi:hypothetical protein